MQLCGRQFPRKYRLETESEMNCIPGLRTRRDRPRLSASVCSNLLLLFLAGAFCSGAESAPASAQIQLAQAAADGQVAERIYHLDYVVTPDPIGDRMLVELTLRQDENLLREINMRAPATQISGATGDGNVLHEGGRLLWHPPESGGTLRWYANINHQRNTRSFDAYMTPDWAIFRAEDIIPQASTRTLRDASSETTLAFKLPRGWSSVTEYFGRNDSYKIKNADRRFDRPAGWMVLGNIGVRYENIADVRVNVAAPVGHGFRRMDILALLRWTIPEVVHVFDDFPGRLTIIGGADPMWRGGLSGPRSLFIHADRPLLSENGTSTLLHEIIHVALGRGAGSGADWIVEGLAEYYGLTILQRSGTISDTRYAASLRKIAEWGEESALLCDENSTGAATARAVTVFSALDEEIRTRSSNAASLDDVIRALAASENDITIHSLMAISNEYLESESKVLIPDNLPGCEF
jgi:hypothetical protein